MYYIDYDEDGRDDDDELVDGDNVFVDYDDNDAVVFDDGSDDDNVSDDDVFIGINICFMA